MEFKVLQTWSTYILVGQVGIQDHTQATLFPESKNQVPDLRHQMMRGVEFCRRFVHATFVRLYSIAMRLCVNIPRKCISVAHWESSDRIFLICICGKVYFSKRKLRDHSLQKHGSEKCDVCHDKPEIMSKAYHHQSKHFQMYRYQCSRCLDRFKTQENFDSKKKHNCGSIRIPAWRLPTVAEIAESSVRPEIQMNAFSLRSRQYLCGVKGCTKKNTFVCF